MPNKIVYNFNKEKMSGVILKCIVCQELTNKYKCLKCNQFYCSLPCYGMHKSDENSCQKAMKSIVITEDSINKDKRSAVRDPFTTEDTVAVDKLELLGYSDEVKNLLYNPHLRNLLKEIDAANSANQAMQAAMQEPLFIEFANACLKIIEPEDS